MASPFNTSLISSIILPYFPSNLILVMAFENVENITELRARLIAGDSELDYTFLDSKMILSSDHLNSAFFRALNDWKTGHMRSKNIHTEILVAMHTTNNITTAFRLFGLSDSTESILVFKVLGPGPPSELRIRVHPAIVEAHLLDLVKGIPIVPWKNILQSPDLKRIVKAYKMETSPISIQLLEDKRLEQEKLESSRSGAKDDQQSIPKTEQEIQAEAEAASKATSASKGLAWITPETFRYDDPLAELEVVITGLLTVRPF